MLHWACDRGHEAMARCLLDCGADVNIRVRHIAHYTFSLAKYRAFYQFSSTASCHTNCGLGSVISEIIASYFYCICM